MFTQKKLRDGGEQFTKTSETVALGEAAYLGVKQQKLKGLVVLAAQLPKKPVIQRIGLGLDFLVGSEGKFRDS